LIPIAIKICSNLPDKKEEITDVGQLVKKIINRKKREVSRKVYQLKAIQRSETK